MRHGAEESHPRMPTLTVRRRHDAGRNDWELIAVWVSGGEASKGGSSLLLSRINRSGKSWSKPEKIPIAGKAQVWDPAWVSDWKSKHSVLVFNSQTKKGKKTVSWMQTLSSFEKAPKKRKKHEVGWSHMEESRGLSDARLKNPAIRGLGGEWLLPVQADFPMVRWSKSGLRDGGINWAHGVEVGGAFGTFRAANPTVVRLYDARSHPSRYLVAFCQSRHPDSIWRSVSDNDGRSWSSLERTALPSSGRPIQAVSLQSGNIALVFPNNRGEPRQGDAKSWPLSIALSEDGGQTWPHVRDLMQVFDPRVEYSSAAIAETPDGMIHVVYAVPGAIRHQMMTEAWIRGRYRWGATQGLYACAEAAEGPPQLACGIQEGEVERLRAP